MYLADGTTQAFDANTNPSSSDFAKVPEGTYHATVGTHNGSKSSYTALKMRDIGAASQTVELGTENPAYSDGRTYASGIDIHKAGKDNYTGMVGAGGVSQGCLLIDTKKWNSFISIFNTPNQKSKTIGVTVSRTFTAPVNAIRLPAFNFIMNGSRRDFFNYKR